MHIILAVLGAVATAFFAFRYFVNAAQEGREAISDVRGAFRRGRWSRKIDRRLIESLEDPRECAAILLYQIAEYDGAITDAQKSAMAASMATAFEADQETTDGLYAFARMAVGELNDAGNSLAKILRPVNEACTEEEKRQLIEMLESIGRVEGPLTDMQQRLISEARRILTPA